jgi:hypothetical protein
MKRLSKNQSVAFLLVLVAAWVCSTGELVRAGCQSMGCTSKCFATTGWCYVDVIIQARTQDQFTSAVVRPGYCTDGAAGGTPAIDKLVEYDEYDDCTPDCAQDVTLTTNGSSAAQAGVKLGHHSGTFKTQCNAS